MASTNLPNPVVAIIGATGTGKSQLAVDLALRFNGEVINADAMQLYDGLPIITNKMSLNERKGVPHHLLGCVSLKDQPWRADTFVKNALNTIADVHARGRLPIIVGGTHYYTQSLLFKDVLVQSQRSTENPDMTDGVASVKTHENAILEQSGEIMLAKLKEVDPVMAARWHPNDVRKIRRSLEIWLHSGKKASDLYEEQENRRKTMISRSSGEMAKTENTHNGKLEESGTGLRFPTLIFWVNVPRELAAERLDTRVDKMVQAGLLEEAFGLEAYANEQESAGKIVDKTRGIYAAVGYKEFRALLDARDVDSHDSAELRKLEEAGIEMTKLATRRYAKTQLRWIRIKLMNALQDAGANKSVMLLDTSSLEEWTSTVLGPALERLSAFLSGEDPAQGDVNGNQALPSPLRNYDLGHRRDLWQRQTCEECKVTTVTEEEWQKHIHGSRHRRSIKNQQKKQKLGAGNNAFEKDGPPPLQPL